MTIIRTRPVTQCIACGSTESSVAYQGLKDRLYAVSGDWSILQCARPQCGLLWLGAMPIAEDIHIAYEQYFTHADEQGQRQKASRWQSLQMKALRWLLNLGSRKHDRQRSAQAYLPRPEAGASLLEIGCGSGDKLAALRQFGWTVYGYELDPKAASHAASKHGIQMFQGELAGIPAQGLKFDAILMNHVFEHLLEPAEVLAVCRNLLRPGGRLVIVTPNARSAGHRQFGAAWLGLDPPRHTYIWSPDCLAAFVGVRGFSIVENFTSKANDDVFLMHSQSIQESGRAEISILPPVAIELKARYREAAAFFASPFAGDLAEECILIAISKADPA
ncbi:MAG: class I SAM-dependent methyltransferase [Pseudomonadota bacterium]